MGDYQCKNCEDRGNCRFCSPDFQPDRVHTSCGHKWRDHPVEHYWAVCPPRVLPEQPAPEGVET